MKLSLIVLLVLVVATAGADAAYFEYDGWPGEGVPGFSVKNSSLQLNRTPNQGSEVISVPVQIGENILSTQLVSDRTHNPRLTYDKSKVITKKSVFWVARSTVTDFNCERMPDGKQSVIQVGEKIEMLQYRAEGYVLARYKGVVCEVNAADSPEKFDGMDQEPEVEWWIRVVGPGKEIFGWLLINESQVNYLQRNF